MYAKKSLGQHFLKSERALNAIVEAGNLSASDTIIEIGPGTGALTEKLFETGVSVIAVEKDDNLFEILKEKFAKEISKGQLILIHDDILKFIENSKLKIENYKLIANIPYNITGTIIKKFLSAENQPERMVLLVQKEVAKRIVAKKKKPFDSAQGKESILSISVKAYGEPRYIETVKAGSFAPAPKVDSAILCIKNISKNFFSEFTETSFFKLLNTGFHSKRKKLSSNLSKMRGIFEESEGKEKVKKSFEKLGLDDNIRAEDLTITLWKELASELLRQTRR